MLLTTAVYLSRPIRVFHGGSLIFNGQQNIPYNLLGFLRLGPDLVLAVGLDWLSEIVIIILILRKKQLKLHNEKGERQKEGE